MKLQDFDLTGISESAEAAKVKVELLNIAAWLASYEERFCNAVGDDFVLGNRFEGSE